MKCRECDRKCDPKYKLMSFDLMYYQVSVGRGKKRKCYSFETLSAAREFARQNSASIVTLCRWRSL